MRPRDKKSILQNIVRQVILLNRRRATPKQIRRILKLSYSKHFVPKNHVTFFKH